MQAFPEGILPPTWEHITVEHMGHWNHRRCSFVSFLTSCCRDAHVLRKLCTTDLKMCPLLINTWPWHIWCLSFGQRSMSTLSCIHVCCHATLTSCGRMVYTLAWFRSTCICCPLTLSTPEIQSYPLCKCVSEHCRLWFGLMGVYYAAWWHLYLGNWCHLLTCCVPAQLACAFSIGLDLQRTSILRIFRDSSWKSFYTCYLKEDPGNKRSRTLQSSKAANRPKAQSKHDVIPKKEGILKNIESKEWHQYGLLQTAMKRVGKSGQTDALWTRSVQCKLIFKMDPGHSWCGIQRPNP